MHSRRCYRRLRRNGKPVTSGLADDTISCSYGGALIARVGAVLKTRWIVALACVLGGCLQAEVGDPIEDGDPGSWQPANDEAPASPEVTTSASLFGAGFCSLAQHGYFHVVANKFASDLGGKYFDVVRGDAYARQLEVCIGTSSGQGGTWVLPANVESTTGEIYQLGYGRGAGRLGNTFVYALGSPTSIEIKSVAPIDGHRYRFEIFRRATYNTVSFRITDLSLASVVWSLDTSHAWSSA